MKIIKTIAEIRKLPDFALRHFISMKTEQFIKDYKAEILGNIGCFIILSENERELFDEELMERKDSVRLYKLPASVYIVGKGEEVYEEEPDIVLI